MRDRGNPDAAQDRQVDVLFTAVLRAGESRPALREALELSASDEAVVVALLRRAVPVALLELLAGLAPWSDKPLVLGAVARNPRVPRALGLKILPSLFWHDLAEIAGNPWTQGALRVRAEGLLKEKLPEMRLGDRIALGRMATAPVLSVLMQEKDLKILEAALQNPRLHQDDLLQQIRAETVPILLLESVARSSRWREQYAIRLGLVLQPRTPLPLALGQVSGLVKTDLVRVAEAPGLRPLLQAAARRVAESPPPEDGTPGRSAR